MRSASVTNDGPGPYGTELNEQGQVQLYLGTIKVEGYGGMGVGGGSLAWMMVVDISQALPVNE